MVAAALRSLKAETESFFISIEGYLNVAAVASVTDRFCFWSRLNSCSLYLHPSPSGPESPYTHWKQTVFYLDEYLTVKTGEEIDQLWGKI